MNRMLAARNGMNASMTSPPALESFEVPHQYRAIIRFSLIAAACEQDARWAEVTVPRFDKATARLIVANAQQRRRVKGFCLLGFVGEDHADEIRQGLGLHLLHDLGSVGFDGLGTDAEL